MREMDSNAKDCLRNLREQLARDDSKVATSVEEFLNQMTATHVRYTTSKSVFSQLRKVAIHYFLADWPTHPGVLLWGPKFITPYIEIVGSKRQVAEGCQHFTKALLFEEGSVTYEEIKLIAQGKIPPPNKLLEIAKEVRERRSAKHSAHEAERSYTGTAAPHSIRDYQVDISSIEMNSGGLSPLIFT